MDAAAGGHYLMSSLAAMYVFVCVCVLYIIPYITCSWSVLIM